METSADTVIRCSFLHRHKALLLVFGGGHAATPSGAFGVKAERLPDRRGIRPYRVQTLDALQLPFLPSQNQFFGAPEGRGNLPALVVYSLWVVYEGCVVLL